jgi:hypothetical protein
MKTPKSFVVVAAAGLGLALSSCCASCWKPSGAERSQGPRLVGYRQVEQIVANPDPKGGMAQVRMVQEPVYEEVAVRRRTCGGSNWGSHRGCVTWFRPDYWPCGTTGPETLAAASAQGSNGAPHIGLIPTMRRLAE